MGLLHAHLSASNFNAHRIDLETSGVLLCAKSQEALRRLSAQFQSRAVCKVYLALTAAAPKAATGVIAAALAPDARRPGCMRVAAAGHPGSRPSETAYTTLKRWRRGHALVQAEPRTGRTHQVRVHFAHAGAPIVAEALYGSERGLYLSHLKRSYKPGPRPERPLIGRLALHAASLKLEHPVDRTPLRIEAPLPDDFALALKALRRHAA